MHWDPFLHAWIVTRYADVVTVLHRFSAARTPTPEQLAALGLESLTPIAAVMVRQMLFLDAPAHTRIRGLASQAFTPRRVELPARSTSRRSPTRCSTPWSNGGGWTSSRMLAAPLPAIVTAEMLGVPTRGPPAAQGVVGRLRRDAGQLPAQPGSRAARVLRSTEEMIEYFRAADPRAASAAARRPGRGAAAGRGRRRPLHRGRGHRQLHRDDGGRAGDDHEPDRQRRTVVAPPPRPARAAARRSPR